MKTEKVITFIEISPNKEERVCNNCTSFYKWGVHTGSCYKHSKKPNNVSETHTCEDFTFNENSEE